MNLRPGLIICGLLVWIPVAAHNVVGDVFAIGDTIEGEVAFSNGTYAKEGTEVVVMSSDGQMLGETTTDGEGVFSFQALSPIDHIFDIDLGEGHKISLTLEAKDLRFASAVTDQAEQAQRLDASNEVASVGVSAQELELLIRRAVADQVKPLQREIREYKASAKWHDVLGGIGFIFGMVGLGMYMLVRKEKRAASA